MKEWLKIAAWLAFGVLCWALRTMGIAPHLSPGWLIAATFALGFAATASMDKARDAWSEHGWCFAAVENVVLGGLLSAFALACAIVAFFTPQP